MPRSLPETLNEAVRATVWERDQEAWNLPRAPELVDRDGPEPEPAAGLVDPTEEGESSNAPESTE